MAEPSIPFDDDGSVELTCGERISRDTFDLGLREFDCSCGDRHAVVMDVHPLGRWIPEAVGDVLRETIEPADEYDTFQTIHLMGLIVEEYPEEVTVVDATDSPSVGYALLWVTELDARELHRVIVELLVELMDHAVSHSEDDDLHGSFTQQLRDFDIDEFVDHYRNQRDLSDRYDRPI